MKLAIYFKEAKAVIELDVEVDSIVGGEEATVAIALAAHDVTRGSYRVYSMYALKRLVKLFDGSHAPLTGTLSERIVML